MKKLFLLPALIALCLSAKSQTILLINDNDNITQNTDTFVDGLLNSDYSTFTYYNAIDSSQMPSEGYLENFDIVIYYASTDGAGLGIWSDGPDGNLAIKGYLASGGRVWLIGTDLLFGGNYLSPTTFPTTSFAYENLGLESYNVQSYGDDGSLGVEQVDFTNSTTIAFPDSLTWIFNTLWWVDGVTTRQDGITLYEMGPTTYSLAGESSMVHYYDIITNVMSTFFDPALINTPQNRIDFINASLDYFWQFDLSVSETENKNSLIKLYPTIAHTELTIESSFKTSQSFEIFSITGQLMQSGILNPQINVVGVNKLSKGVYFVKVGQTTQKFIKQ